MSLLSSSVLTFSVQEDTYATMTSCPFSARSAELYGGLTVDSYQLGEWGRLFGSIIIGPDRLIWPGVECQDGAMRLSVSPVGDEVPTYLTNHSGWETVSEAVEIHSGSAVATTDTIAPEGGDPYDVSVSHGATTPCSSEPRSYAPPETAVSWLNLNIPRIIANLAAWDGEVVAE